MTNRYSEIQKKLDNTSRVILDLEPIIPEISKTIDVISNCLIKGNKIVLFGNGGSAADAQHIAAELIGRFNFNRSSLPAIALTSCLLYTSPSPRDRTRSRMPSSA